MVWYLWDNSNAFHETPENKFNESKRKIYTLNIILNGKTDTLTYKYSKYSI